MTVSFECPLCGYAFEVPRSLAGGMVNCPDCDKAVPVPSGGHWQFWSVVGLGMVLVLGAGVGVGMAQGWGAGLVVGLIGGAVLGVWVLCM
ncbi:MAG: hypothetical protein AB7O52_10085 [Planctomycetota bacterium]